MKNLLFSVLLIIISIPFSFSQKIKKEKIEINYTKLPLTPLPSNLKTYSTKSEFAQGAFNRDGTNVFKVGTVEATGFVSYGHPEVKFKDKTKEFEDKYLKLEGYQKANGIADVSIIIKFGLLTVKKSGEERPYVNGNKRCGDQPYTYSLPCTLFVKTKDGKELSNNIISSGINSTTSHTTCYGNTEKIGDTGVEFALCESLSNQYYKSAQNIIVNSISTIKAFDELPIFYVKPKNFDYSDLDKAANDFKNTVSAMNINQQDEKAIDGFKSSIEIWTKAIKEVDFTNKKARINKEIACALNYNCALAYWRLNDFENAKKTLSEAKSEFEKESLVLENIITDSEKRYNANFKK